MKGNARRLLKAGFVLLLFVGVSLAYVSLCQALDRDGSRQIRVFIIPQQGGVVEPEPGDYSSLTQSGGTTSGQTYLLQRDHTITFIAEANAGYVFNGWYLNGNYEGNFEIITVTMNQNWELHAVFSGPASPGTSPTQDQTLDLASIALAIAALVISIIVGVVVLAKLRNTAPKT